MNELSYVLHGVDGDNMKCMAIAMCFRILAALCR